MRVWHKKWCLMRNIKMFWCLCGWSQMNDDWDRLESMTEEVGALHEAMAGLHGEMGAVQRELDGANASRDKLTTGV